MSYSPHYLAGFSTGLIQNRKNFTLPEDAFPELNNAFIFREGIYKKQGCKLIGRLSRSFPATVIPGGTGASPWTFNIFSLITTQAVETNKQLNSVVITISTPTPIVLIDQGNGLLETNLPSGNSGTIDYWTGSVTITHTAGVGVAATVSFDYYPGLPVLGICRRELAGINQEQTVFFDQVYAYIYNGTKFIELSSTAPKIWSGSNSDLFTSANYWVAGTDSQANSRQKLFWVTNSYLNDPIRYHNGTTWTDFSPVVNGTNKLLQCQVLIPFRGRLLALNTVEGVDPANGIYYFQRIRWSQIGSPLLVDSWRDDIRGKGGFLDIPTDQNITGAGFVRDNLVIYCERSTWQLRYTGNSIIPFQIERVNSELGSTSKVSMVQFDTSLAGIGDKALIECDSFSVSRLDLKIPDLVQNIENQNDSRKRICGIRNINNRSAYWTYLDSTGSNNAVVFPNKRLYYNYENKSFGIFDDSITYLGFFQPTTDLRWVDCDLTWNQADFDWRALESLNFEPCGGNQQGFVFYLDQTTQNDDTLFIKGIQAFGTAPGSGAVEINCPNHNLKTGTFVLIRGIQAPDPFAVLNNKIYLIQQGKNDSSDPTNYFRISSYNTATRNFNPVVLSAVFVFSGAGLIAVRDNFSIKTKQFHYIDQGRNIQLGFLDLLIQYLRNREISINIYQDYATYPSNIYAYNTDAVTPTRAEPFFNEVVSLDPPTNEPGNQGFLRIFCPVQSAFLTIQLTFNDEQMSDLTKSETPISISALVLWMRAAGTQININ